MKSLLILCYLTCGALFFPSCGAFVNKKSDPALPAAAPTPRPTFASSITSSTTYISPLASRAAEIKEYASRNGFSTTYCFLVDMAMHSGRKRFFVYDLYNNQVVASGLIGHGSCKENYLTEARFSNAPGCGCTSSGKYKVGELYRGQYGKSYKLYGLESTNSNAYRRAIVLHGNTCVPNEDIYPKVVCNSLGCAMVSPIFFEQLASVIDHSRKPILLWIYK